MDTDIRQEDFSYYSEGVLTWIYTHESEQENIKAFWQEYSCSIQETCCSYVGTIGQRQEGREGAAWRAAPAPRTYERAEIGYWDTG